MFPKTEIQENFERIAERINDLEQKPALFGGDAVYGSGIIGQIGPEIEGMQVSVPWHISTDKGQAKTFLDEALSIWDTSSLNWRSALAMDSTLALVGAVDQGNVSDKDNNGIITP